MKLTGKTAVVGRWVGRLRHRAATFGRQGVRLLFPPCCVHCDAELLAEADDLMLCDACCGKLSPPAWTGCPRCGALLAGKTSAGAAGCPVCREVVLRFEQVIPLGAYDGVLREAVLKTKRLGREDMANALGCLLARRRSAELSAFRPDLIVPIPMYWSRRLRRGINSPEILARCLGRHLGVPVAQKLLVRTRNTPPQKDLMPGERFRNVRGAFRLGRGGVPGGPERLQDSRIILVDDILTTGATCSEAAGVLKRAGVQMVAAAVVAKAPASETISRADA